MKKKICILMILLLAFVICPMSTYAEADSIGSGDGSGASGSGSSSNKWAYYNGKGLVAGIRMTVIDRNGNMVAGTHTVDFVNYPSLKGDGYYMNSNANRFKNAVVNGSLSWKKDSYTYIQSPPSGVTIKFDSNDNLKINGKRVDTYFQNLAKTKELYNNYIVKTGYNRDNVSNYNQHYIIIEPVTMVIYKGKHYYGTATELAKLIGNSGTLSTVPKKYLARSICYPGDFINGGNKNNGVTLASGDTLLAYSKGTFASDGDCAELSSNSDLLKKSSGRVVGNGVGIFYASAILPNMCDINNPEHFHVVDGSDDQDYKSNDKTATCCSEMISKYGQAYVEQRYPICGSCPVKTTSKTNACGSEDSVILTDEHDFSCIFKGVSGKSSSKYDYSSRQAVRKKYKVGTIGSKYCEVYCTDDIVGQFPGNYQGQVTPGGSFIWPSYNNDYKASIQTTRTCKIRFRQQEWLNAFNKGTATQKETLVKALKECAGQNSILAYYDKYIDALNPTLALSYNNGVTTIGPKTLKLDKTNSTYSKTCSGCNVSTSGLTVSNVVSKLNSIATGITNKVLTIKTNLRYVLPDGLYQYVDKKTGLALETYTAEKEINSNGTKNNTKVIDTGSSKLVVNENAKVSQKYNLTIEYSKLSAVSGKFTAESGKYTCTYTPTNNPTGNQCDYNETNHFKDIDGDGTLDSGPNGEDCCEWFANKYGTNSDEYKKLVSRGDCPDPGTPDCDPNDPDCDSDCDPDDPNCPYGNSCEYPKDLTTTDVAVKNKCCAMILVDNRYTLEERNQYYNQYCTAEPYCPQDCVNGKCTDSPMTQQLRNCMASGKSYNECKIDNCPGGGSILIYRPISLLANEAFPGVEKNNRIWSNNNWYYYSNWAYRGNSKKRDYYVNMYITNNRGVKEYEIYNLEPMYTIKLDAKTISSIRNYNKTNSYDDFNLKCTNGRQCKSTYIRQTIAGKVTGCGVSSDWYACQGISAERGD